MGLLLAVRKLSIGIAGAALLALAWLGLPDSGQADSPKKDCAGDPASSDLANGEGTIAISERELIIIGRKDQGCMYQRTASKGQLIRHVAVADGVGTAYVEDQQGSDAVVVFTEEGAQRLPTDGEATQPSWSADGDLVWAEDFTSLKMWSPSSRTRTIALPNRATGVFSPVFADGTLTAVAQETAGGQHVLTEDDMLNNLYAYADGGWERLTDFEVGPGEWSVIRTPVTTAAGDILFVRVHGNYQETLPPNFELWKLAGGSASKIENLPGEMFLAGMRGGRLMWNAYSATCGDWELLVQRRTGDLRHLGCGAVLVDPVNITDADLEVDEHAAEVGTTPDEPVEVGVVIGDFTQRSAAVKVARKVPGSEVVTSKQAPAAVAPGAFAVARRVTGDPHAALRAVKRALPSLRDQVFLAPLGR